MSTSTPRPSAKKAPASTTTTKASTKAQAKPRAKAATPVAAKKPAKSPVKAAAKAPAKVAAKAAAKVSSKESAKVPTPAPAKAAAKTLRKQPAAKTVAATGAASAPAAKRVKKTDSTLWSRPGFLIRRLHQIHCALFAEEVPDATITPVQYSLLSTLDEFGELDQNTLSHRIGLERTSVAEVLPRLEDRLLIERKRSEEDGRIRLVALTADGKALLDSLAAAVARAHARTVEALPAAERKELMRMMALLVTADSSERAPLLKRR